MRPGAILEGFFGSVLFTGLASGFTWAGTWYQGVLKAEQSAPHAGQLDGVGAFVVGLPTAGVILAAVVFAAVVGALLIWLAFSLMAKRQPRETMAASWNVATAAQNERMLQSQREQIEKLSKDRDDLHLELASAMDKGDRAYNDLMKQSTASKALHDDLQRTTGERDEYKRGHDKWEEVAPLAAAYARTRNLADRISKFIAEENAKKLVLSHPLPNDYVVQSVMAIKRTKTAFDAQLLPELVKLLEDLRGQFGLVNAAFPDNVLTDAFTGPVRFQEFVSGLELLAEQIKNMLAEKASSI